MALTLRVGWLSSVLSIPIWINNYVDCHDEA